MLKKLILCIMCLNLAFASGNLGANSVKISGANSSEISSTNSAEISAKNSDEISEFIAKNGVDLQNLANEIPNKVYASSPPLLYLLYAIAPEKIAGVTQEFTPIQRRYIAQNVLNQPVVGGFFGQGKIPNMETLIKINPDLVLLNAGSLTMKSQVAKTFAKFKKPMLYIDGFTLDGYIKGFAALGKILGKEQRAHELIDYSKNFLNTTEKVEQFLRESGAKKVTMYYANGKDGLRTECDSRHTQLIRLSGGENVYKCPDNKGDHGRVTLNFEQVLSLNPQMILVYERSFFEKIFSDPKWKMLSAVQNKKVYFIPREPFSWFDRPPSFMRFLGVKWLANLAYPQAIEFDAKREMREFYKVFFGLDLSDADIEQILNG